MVPQEHLRQRIKKARDNEDEHVPRHIPVRGDFGEVDQGPAGFKWLLIVWLVW